MISVRIMLPIVQIENLTVLIDTTDNDIQRESFIIKAANHLF